MLQMEVDHLSNWMQINYPTEETQQPAVRAHDTHYITGWWDLVSP